MRKSRADGGVGPRALRRRSTTAVRPTVVEGQQGRTRRRHVALDRAQGRAKPAYYVVLRDGKSLGKVKTTSYTDSKVGQGRTYRYSVRAYDSRSAPARCPAASAVTIPKVAASPKLPASPTINPVEPIATVTPTPTPTRARRPRPAHRHADGDRSRPPRATPSADAPHRRRPRRHGDADCDRPTADCNRDSRLPHRPADRRRPGVPRRTRTTSRTRWSTGCSGAPDSVRRRQQRDVWRGRSQAELVDWFLNTPASLDTTMPAPKSQTSGGPIDPLASPQELELEWIDRMQRAVNPLPERMALFWHRHWAISLADGSVSDKWALAYRNHLLEFSDFGSAPTLTFRQLAYEMTTKNAAMSAYLNLNANTKTKPNENYAREFMELFCLGPTHPETGAPNYTQADIEGLTQAFTGWRLTGAEFLPDGTTPNPDYGKITFAPNQFTMTAKTILGRTIPAVSGSTNPTTNPASMQWGPDAVNAATDIVLERAVHPQFLIRKLWSEFIASPIPQATLDSLISTYLGSNPKYQLRPVIRGILMNPLIFESLDEPNLVKPPIIFMVGVLRQLGAPLRHGGSSNLPGDERHAAAHLRAAECRRLGGRHVLVQHQHRAGPLRDDRARPVPARTATTTTDGAATVNYPPDVVPKSCAGRRRPRCTRVNRPWISRRRRTALIAWAGTMPTIDSTRRTSGGSASTRCRR